MVANNSLPTKLLIEDPARARSLSHDHIIRFHHLMENSDGNFIFAMEGRDDVLYYQVAIEKIVDDLDWVPLWCGGKSKVLSLRKHIGESTVFKFDRILFFVDRDFDEPTNLECEADIYMTPGYSIENNLVSLDVFKKILISDFDLSAGTASYDLAVRCCEWGLCKFLEEIKLVNRMLFLCKRKGVKIGKAGGGKSIYNAKKYLSIELNEIRLACDIGELLQRAGVAAEVSTDQLLTNDDAFEKLDPFWGCNGKLLLSFFMNFIGKLAGDMEKERGDGLVFRNDDANRKIRRAILMLDPATRIRTLAALALPPDCLRNFIERWFGKASRDSGRSLI